jgi:molybdopterin-guanine dinucleotide biosynthesis protein A
MNGEVVAVLLAGGLSRRMGGQDKMLRDLGGKSILSRVVARIKSQADRLLLNANGDAARVSDFGLPVAADVIEASGGRHHPVCGLWPVRLAGELRRAMLEEDIRKVDIWTARYKLAVADWPTDPVDPFFNANRPEDLAEAERILGETG